VTLVLVDQDLLAQLIESEYANRHEIAVEGGCATLWEDEWRFLDPDDVLVTLAVQAGLPIPGPLTGPPPAPPSRRVVGLSSTYKDEGDNRLRCTADGKVVYTSREQAERAATKISQRQPMLAYLGRCGHYHVSRDRRRHGKQVARALTEGEGS
jgi:hypothetical protein